MRFVATLTDEQKAGLETLRQRHGLRSEADVLRRLIETALETHHPLSGGWRWTVPEGVNPLSIIMEGRGLPLADNEVSQSLDTATAFLRANPAAGVPFRGMTPLGEPLPDRKPYQKTGKK